MQIGVTFPQTEIGADPQAIRDYAQAVEAMGYQHVLVYDHVLGADPTNRPGWAGYTHTEMFHEPFVLFGYLAALTKLELVTGVIILPQRQTTLVAKQAAEVDVLSGGKFRLGIGVGWNPVEYEGLGMNFSTRGRVVEEQIELLRQLWSKELITFKGKYHTVTEAGLNPLPVRRSIPVWIGGSSDVTLRRAARIADGWFPLGRPDDKMRGLLDRLASYLQEAGRERQSFGIEARVSASEGDLDQQVRETEKWRSYGATHISFNTMNAGFTSLDQHLQALQRYKEAVKR
ncbi:LLM class F420-dependent oxidoreductase [Dictyobacter formicarum]|uniref:LLM class F420-dependent oxidoreductase n=1 Tax=Dictyobacter formicarum TaxID=2778368 RepID=A0ABQ3VVQ0_9CHLR|nr:LLM class F420-dependent oxidoreductase [Dictyobacter formicarum]GHO89749.1 LLM class F420-dependent oxidoreductase [Dictyobacter formicarum]